jgi:hypothetical protein
MFLKRISMWSLDSNPKNMIIRDANHFEPTPHHLRLPTPVLNAILVHTLSDIATVGSYT